MKTHIKEIIYKAFKCKNGTSYKLVVLGYDSTYLTTTERKDKSCYTEQQVLSTQEFPLDNIFVTVGGNFFNKLSAFLLGTNCAPLLTDIFPYSYESVSHHNSGEGKECLKKDRSLNFLMSYIDAVHLNFVLNLNVYLSIKTRN